MPEDLRRIAIAVECFHKASLIHDDIEDEDHGRYGLPTLHAEHGVAVALNAGDLLIGEGYRLISECQASAEAKVEMLQSAARGQRELCLGQGADLLLVASAPTPQDFPGAGNISPENRTGLCGGVGTRRGLCGPALPYATALRSYSENLGIAYQIRDDMEDLGADAGDNALERPRLSVLLSVAQERAKGDDKAFLDSLWNNNQLEGVAVHKLRHLAQTLKADEKCKLLLETYKDTAIRSLQDVDNANLKGLLRRVMGKIFADLEIKGWCREFEVKNGVREEAATEIKTPVTV
ncbi:MAG: polyprenyl synthetase family protein [Verrucomicrobiales bacterium]